MGSCGIPVTITSKGVVAPSSHHQTMATSRHPLSNLDYLFIEEHKVSVYFCYAKAKDFDHQTMVGVLRKSLARTLTHFPVFSGEVVTDSVGEPESLLSNRGVDFFEATSVMELGDLDLFHPDVSIRDYLIPEIQQGVLAVQVTEMKCGGLVVGVTFDHRVADAYSANMFLLSWSETALHGHPTSFAPIIDRSLLCPRQLVAASASSGLDKWYAPLSRDEPQRDPCEEDFTTRTFYVEAHTIRRLQEEIRLKNGSEARSKFEAFTACLWQLLAKSATGAATSFKVSIVVDGRTRMYTGKSAQNAALMHNYFGNAVCFPFAEATASSLRSMSLSDAAGLIHRCKAESTTPEHLSDVIDWVEERRPMMPKMRVCLEEEAVMVSSGQRFPVTKVDFGWGKPAFGSYYFPLKAESGYVMPMPSATKDGDWVVFMYLRKRHMEVVERDGGHIFKPLVSSYLNFPSP